MPKTPPKLSKDSPEILTGTRRKAIPFEFVLDALDPLAPATRPMFGCLAVYVDDKIMLILRDRESHPRDNGVWLATAPEHHQSLLRELPMMRSIGLFGKKQSTWQVVPADAAQFEEAARRVCELVLKRDVRIGKVPRSRSRVKSPATGVKSGKMRQGNPGR